MPLASTTTSLPALKPQSASSASSTGVGGLGVLGRVDEHHQVPALAEKPLQHVGFRLQQVGFRSRDDDHRGVGRHVGRLREDGLGDVVVVALERPFGAAESVALGAVDVAFAVSLDEVDLLLASGQHLDQSVGQVLLVGRGHALGSALVLDDHRAVALHLVLTRLDRALVRVDVLAR